MRVKALMEILRAPLMGRGKDRKSQEFAHQIWDKIDGRLNKLDLKMINQRDSIRRRNAVIEENEKSDENTCKKEDNIQFKRRNMQRRNVVSTS